MIWLIGIVIAFMMFCLGVMLYDGTHFVVHDYTISTDKISKNYCMVVLSDLHDKTYGKNNEKLIKAIEEKHPDGIYVAGDLVTAEKGADPHCALSLLKNLRDKGYPIYYGYGNHEQKLLRFPQRFDNMGVAYEKKLYELGVTVLKNESITIPDYRFCVTGLAIEHQIYYKRFQRTVMEKKYLEDTLGENDPGTYTILLAHNPDYFDAYANWGADLVLSGHVHGGIVKLPLLGGVISPSFRLFPKYDGGLFREGKSTMVLSRGLGTHTLPIRLFNPAELVTVELKTKEKDKLEK
ncbi:MAG: metallophosphoesterase [Lachnospiraceae bacterium]|nr:metallophosphoesterase [Lachnospiraceae bacterium]